METAKIRTFMDWEIRTIVAIDNLDGWKPGDADRYFVRGIAERNYESNRFSYSSNEPLIYDTQHFTDSRLAPSLHGRARMELEQKISGLMI